MPATTIAWVVLAVGAYGGGILLGVGQTAEEGFRRYEVLRLACCGIATAAIVVGAWRRRPSHLAPWFLLAALCASWAVRPIKDLFLEGPPPLGGWYFFGQLTFTAVTSIGALGLFVRHRRMSVDRVAALDVAVMLLAYVAFLIHLSVLPGWTFAPRPFQLGAAIVFPVNMAALLVLTCVLLFLDEIPGRSFTLLWIGVATAIGPNLYTLVVDTGDGALTAIAIDTTPLTVFLFVAAAVDPDMVLLTEPSRGTRPAWSDARCALLGFTLALPLIALVSGEEPGPVEGTVLVALVIAAILLLVVRARGAVNGLQTAERSSRANAGLDPLTSLLNRRGLLEHLTSLQGRPMGVAFVDIDRFKLFNDAYGHSAGDELLVAVARRISAVADGCVVARLGGDEFAVAYPVDAVGDDTGQRLGALLHGALEPSVPIGPYAATITASVGLAELPIEAATGGDAPARPLAADVAELLRQADLAQYRAKTAGGARTVRFTDEMGASAIRSVQVVDAVRAREHPEWLDLHYQAVVRLDGEDVVGCEALARLTTPTLGSVPPLEFVAAAERYGLIIPLGDRLLEILVRDVRTAEALPDGFRVAYNLSTRQLGEPVGIRGLEALAAEDPDLLARLRVEVTESAVATDGARLAIRRLSELGYQIAIDDFGTDYASLQYLATTPVDVLKLDRSFVAGMFANETDAKIVRHCLAMATDLGIEVVAEGIETPRQAERLAELGCAYGQGFLWDRPAPDLARFGAVVTSG